MKKWGFGLTVVFAILLSLGLGVITAGFSLMFSPEKLTTVSYWTNWGITQITSLLLFYLLIGFFGSKNEERDEYKTNEKTLKELTTAVDVDFSDFIVFFNRENKKRAWIKKNKGKIIKFKEKINRIKGHMKLNRFDLWRIRKFENKIKYRESLILPEYIEENIDFIKIKYARVSRAQLYNGEYEDENRGFIVSPKKFLLQTGASRLLISAIISGILTAVAVNLFVGLTPDFIVVMISLALSEIFIFVSAKMASNVVYKRYNLINQLNRITIFKQYAAWRK